ncbi:MAG TPA: hypothetical protein VGM56_32120 [Byssovorax sp.]|jgi:integrase
MVNGKPAFCALVTVDKPEGGTRREWYSLGTDDRAQARRKLKRLVTAIASKASAAEVAAAASTDTIASFTVDCAARLSENDRANLRLHVVPHVGGVMLGDAKPSHAKEVRDRALDDGLVRESVTKILGSLNRLFLLAVEDELVSVSPAAAVRVPRNFDAARAIKKEREILDDAQFLRLLAVDVGDVEVQTAAILSRVLVGMRTSDVNAWDWGMIDRVGFASCWVPRTKTKTPQFVEVPEAYRTTIRTWWETHGSPSSGPVFPVQKGENVGGFKARRGISYAKRLRRAMYRAGIVKHACLCRPPALRPAWPSPCCENFASDPLYYETSTTLPVDFHSCRRAFCVAVADSGVNAQTAMKLAAHADYSTHKRYTARHEARQIPASAVPQLPGAIAGTVYDSEAVSPSTLGHLADGRHTLKRKFTTSPSCIT